MKKMMGNSLNGFSFFALRISFVLCTKKLKADG